MEVEDAYVIRALDQAGLNFIVSNSFSKISLYGSVLAALSYVTMQKLLSAHSVS